jgi:hypothetical protein
MAEHLASIFGTEKDRVNCPFYFKVRACSSVGERKEFRSLSLLSSLCPLFSVCVASRVVLFCSLSLSLSLSLEVAAATRALPRCARRLFFFTSSSLSLSLFRMFSLVANACDYTLRDVELRATDWRVQTRRTMLSIAQQTNRLADASADKHVPGACVRARTRALEKIEAAFRCCLLLFCLLFVAVARALESVHRNR